MGFSSKQNSPSPSPNKVLDFSIRRLCRPAPRDVLATSDSLAETRAFAARIARTLAAVNISSHQQRRPRLATLSALFIQMNQSHFAIALARTRYDQAAVSFRKTLLHFRLQALIDVDNALSARTQLPEERRPTRALQKSLWPGNRLQRLQSYASLCQALGGGRPRLMVSSPARVRSTCLGV